LSIAESVSVVIMSVWLTTWLRVYVVQRLTKRYSVYVSEKEAARKAAESTWFGVYYLVMWGVAVSLCFKEPWLYDSRLFWRGFPHLMARRFGVYYAIQGGYYVSSLLFELNVFPHLRAHYKDRPVMLFHHVVALLLISLSSLIGYWRIGMAVFLLHDVSDIALEGGKTQTRLRVRGNHITLFIFAVLFFVTRLVLYPIHIVYSACVVAYEELAQPPWGRFFNVLLLLLQAMHVYWFILIVRTAFRVVQAGRFVRDIRSEDEDSVKESDAIPSRPMSSCSNSFTPPNAILKNEE
jgi:hypothetical protein